MYEQNEKQIHFVKVQYMRNVYANGKAPQFIFVMTKCVCEPQYAIVCATLFRST